MTGTHISPLLQNISSQIAERRYASPMFTSPVKVRCESSERTEDYRLKIRHDVLLRLETTISPEHRRSGEYMRELEIRSTRYFRNLIFGDIEGMLYEMKNCYEIGDFSRGRELYATIQQYMGF